MMPTYSELNVRINKYITDRDHEWCGVPMPLPGLGLVLANGYPHAERVQQLQEVIGNTEPPEYDEEWREVNRWHDHRQHGDIIICRHTDGRTQWVLDAYAPRRNKHLFGPFDTSQAWDLDTEIAAMDKLASLLTAHQFKLYILTSAFIESSPRSGLFYMFRRCRPTVVMTPHKCVNEMRVLACLCLHPLAYYAHTFGGAMVPTDDVIAHLLLMRGDEHMLWKRANQHQAISPESGL